MAENKGGCKLNVAIIHPDLGIGFTGIFPVTVYGVIACNSGAPVETVKNGETGFLCDCNPREFSLAMAKLITDLQMAQRQHVTGSFSTKIFRQHLNQYIVDVARTKRD